MVFNPEQRYTSARSPVAADNLVATSQPLATEAGLQALRNGGNALDAALAAAITLTVVEPNNNGLGSDAFALLWDGQQVIGLNASGRAPAAWFLDRFAGRKRMPELGWDSVTVPGAVSSWVALSDRYGKLPFEALFESAIHYAKTVSWWGRSLPLLAAAGGHSDYPDWIAHFGPVPKAGERFMRPDMVASLEAIGTPRARPFIAASWLVLWSMQARGEGVALADLADHTCDW